MGTDIVVDFYHHQMAVSKYFKQGGTTEAALGSAQLNPYIGVAFGFSKGVWDWDGVHGYAGANPQLEIHIPFLGGAHLGATTEAFLNEHGVSGGTVGAEISISAVPFDLLPGPDVAVEAGTGLFSPFEAGLRSVYKSLRNGGVDGFGFIPVDAHLLDHYTGAACDPDGDLSHCHIEFGDPSMSHTERAVELAKGMCGVAGLNFCVLQAAPMAVNLAIGYARDYAVGAADPAATEVEGMTICPELEEYDACFSDYQDCQ